MVRNNFKYYDYAFADIDTICNHMATRESAVYSEGLKLILVGG